MTRDLETRMAEVAQQYGRYKANAYLFTYEAVSYTVDRRYAATLELGHVTGREVLDGIKELALARFGFMAKTVFQEWGVGATEDFGEIVFHLVREGVVSKTENDTVGDFARGFDFDEVFVRNHDWLGRLAEPRTSRT
jgi:uncharacterized repeat protein (TIGR04138 family)